MKKAIVVIAAVLLLAAFSSGCFPDDSAYNNLDTKLFYANIKADADANHGKKAAVHDGRIYYLSAESGEQGVHSMRADGGDTRFEFAAEDVRALAACDDGFYYAGFSGMGENSNGAFRNFRLYYRPYGRKAIDLLSGILHADGLEEYGVWDFYPAGDGTIVLHLSGSDWVQGYIFLVLLTLKDNKPARWPQYALLKEDTAFANASNTARLLLYQYRDLYIASNSTLLYDKEDVLIDGGLTTSVYDASANRSTLGMDRIFSGTNDNDYSDRWICRVDGPRMLLTSDNGLAEYDMETRSARDITTFYRPESVFSHYDRGNDVLLLTQKQSADFPYIGWMLRVLSGRQVMGENLYRVNPETGEKAQLLAARPGQAFVYVD